MKSLSRDGVVLFKCDGGIRMSLDMKGCRRLYFKVAGREAYSLFCGKAGVAPVACAADDFTAEILFSGVSWFCVNKLAAAESSRYVAFREWPAVEGDEKRIRIDFPAGSSSMICVRLKYDHITIRALNSKLMKAHRRVAGPPIGGVGVVE